MYRKTWPVQMEMDVDFSSDFFVNIELKMTNRLQVINWMPRVVQIVTFLRGILKYINSMLKFYTPRSSGSLRFFFKIHPTFSFSIIFLIFMRITEKYSLKFPINCLKNQNDFSIPRKKSSKKKRNESKFRFLH